MFENDDAITSGGVAWPFTVERAADFFDALGVPPAKRALLDWVERWAATTITISFDKDRPSIVIGTRHLWPRFLDTKMARALDARKKAWDRYQIDDPRWAKAEQRVRDVLRRVRVRHDRARLVARQIRAWRMAWQIARVSTDRRLATMSDRQLALSIRNMNKMWRDARQYTAPSVQASKRWEAAATLMANAEGSHRKLPKRLFGENPQIIRTPPVPDGEPPTNIGTVRSDTRLAPQVATEEDRKFARRIAKDEAAKEFYAEHPELHGNDDNLAGEWNVDVSPAKRTQKFPPRK